MHSYGELPQRLEVVTLTKEVEVGEQKALNLFRAEAIVFEDVKVIQYMAPLAGRVDPDDELDVALPVDFAREKDE